MPTHQQVLSLHSVLIREAADSQQGIYVVQYDANTSTMYQLTVQNPKDRNEWIRKIK